MDKISQSEDNKKPRVVKLNRRETYGVIGLGIAIIIMNMLTFLVPFLVLEGGLIGIITAAIGSFIGTIIGLLYILFYLGWAYEAHHNANVINGENILPWDPWVSALSAIIPILNISLFLYSIYKIMTVSGVMKTGKIALLAYSICNWVYLLLLTYITAQKQRNFLFALSEQGIIIHQISNITEILIPLAIIPVVYCVYKAQSKHVQPVTEDNA